MKLLGKLAMSPVLENAEIDNLERYFKQNEINEGVDVVSKYREKI